MCKFIILAWDLAFLISKILFFAATQKAYILTHITVLKRGTVNPEVVGSIPAKTKKTRTQICMDLSYLDPQARVLKYSYNT